MSRLATAKMRPTDQHRQSASMFLCWPANVIDLCKTDADLPKAVEAVAVFIASWEEIGRSEMEEEVAAAYSLLAEADSVIHFLNQKRLDATDSERTKFATLTTDSINRHFARQADGPATSDYPGNG